MKTRDEIWTLALLKAGAKGETFDRETIEEKTGSGERTVRDCLDTIADTPFLDKTIREGKVVYRPGPEFR